MKITEIAKPQKITILDLFENRAQYNQMMAGLVKAGLVNQDYVDRYISNFRTHLKRNDRIVWALSWLRRYILVEDWRDAGDNEEQKAIISQLYKKATKGIDIQTDNDAVKNAGVFSLYFLNPHSLAHLASNFEQIQSINELQWDVSVPPGSMMSTIRDLEQQWVEAQRQIIEPEEGDEVILSYDNGKYGWVLLDRESCDTEGEAMGHCGNTATPSPGDRILSFRSLFGRTQKPHLTFILGQNGYLGEMKGRANTKPAEKYHPYIIDLLKQDFVKGIRGGGYAPDQNFELSDLEPDVSGELLKIKPSLGRAVDLWMMNDKIYSPEIGKKLAIEIEDSPLDIISFDIATGNIIIDAFKDLTKVADYVHDADLERLSQYEMFGGNNYLDIDPHIDSYAIQSIYDDLESPIQEAIIQYLKKNEEWDEDLDIADMINDSYGDVGSAFASGISDGYQLGTEREMWDNVRDWLSSNHFKPIDDSIMQNIESVNKHLHNIMTKDNFSDYGYALVIPAILVLSEIKYGNLNLQEDYYSMDWDDVIAFDNFSMPYDGYEEFDHEAAVNRTREALQEFIDW